MASRRRLPGETDEQFRLRYNAEARVYRAKRKAEGRPLASSYDYQTWRDNRNMKAYGKTTAELTAIWESQGCKCAICATPVELDNRGKTKHSAVDHCHTTGKVRGILCMHCNQGLGKFFDNTASLQNAIGYLLA